MFSWALSHEIYYLCRGQNSKSFTWLEVHILGFCTLSFVTWIPTYWTRDPIFSMVYIYAVNKILVIAFQWEEWSGRVIWHHTWEGCRISRHVLGKCVRWSKGEESRFEFCFVASPLRCLLNYLHFSVISVFNFNTLCAST